MSTVKQKIRYLIPVPVKKALKYCYYSAGDMVDFLKGKKSDLPPRRLNFVGSADFENVAKEFFGHFVEKGGLKPSDSVLDIGCGIGRMAYPLTTYLNAEGKYYGFDIDKKGINWCQSHLTKRFPNFQFAHVDLYNKYYNQKGTLLSSEFSFPYSDSQFTFAFATSVFTHMLPKDVIHYLHETSRVLKSGGKALVTFFSLDETTQKNTELGLSKCNFMYSYDADARYSHKDVIEAEIGYLEPKIREMISEAGFEIEKLYHGSWSGRTPSYSYQDMWVLRKK